MAKIIMLGTGAGTPTELYNTCFVIQNEVGNFLVDTGGSVEVVKRLKSKNIDYKNIKHIFISHSHTDHILGIFWFFKKLFSVIMRGEINEKVNIYCNDVVLEAIKEVAKYILPKRVMDAVYSVVNFVVLNDGDKHTINGVEYQFFDIHGKGTKQYGFESFINNKKLIFLGDETLNPNLYQKVKNADYVMHEAFCLESEEHIFHAYEKHHSTVKSACSTMSDLNVKNLILYHTEDTHGDEKKVLYTEEAQSVFNENVIVPDDLEEIVIS